uniref:Uncharacterized protein n=1 Tax=Rhizophora mucronata TaxID=61149 RepID=A0A2P2K544_RHIMU
MERISILLSMYATPLRSRTKGQNQKMRKMMIISTKKKQKKKR